MKNAACTLSIYRYLSRKVRKGHHKARNATYSMYSILKRNQMNKYVSEPQDASTRTRTYIPPFPYSLCLLYYQIISPLRDTISDRTAPPSRTITSPAAGRSIILKTRTRKSIHDLTITINPTA